MTVYDFAIELMREAWAAEGELSFVLARAVLIRIVSFVFWAQYTKNVLYNMVIYDRVVHWVFILLSSLVSWYDKS